MARRDAWADPSKVSREDAVRMAAFLEDRARCPDQRQVNDWLIAVLGPRPGERILEAGSGSGVLCRMAALRVSPGGSVIGVDVSRDMVSEARRYAAGDPPGVSFDVAPADALPFPDGTFDAAFAARLLLHVPDPPAVLRQLARVTRPGGRVVVMDWDLGTLALDHPDRALTRRIMEWRADHHSGDNWSGRQLRRWMLELGLRDVAVLPVATLALDADAALTGSVFRAAEVACDGGAIIPAERDAWTAVLRERLAADVFLAGVTYFVVRGERG